MSYDTSLVMHRRPCNTSGLHAIPDLLAGVPHLLLDTTMKQLMAPGLPAVDCLPVVATCNL